MHQDIIESKVQAIISKIDISDLSNVKKISDLAFGENYLTINSLNKILNHSGVFTKITVNNKLAGFCIAVTIDSLVDKKWFSTKEFESTCCNFPYGVIKSIAIHPEFQDKGLGSKLLEATVLKLEAQFELENLFFPAWVIKDKTRLKSKLIQLGFRFTKQLDQYWFNESIQFDYKCKYCGNPPCTCSLGLFKKLV